MKIDILIPPKRASNSVNALGTQLIAEEPSNGSSFSLERRLSRQCQDWRGFHRNRRHGVA